MLDQRTTEKNPCTVSTSSTASKSVQAGRFFGALRYSGSTKYSDLQQLFFLLLLCHLCVWYLDFLYHWGHRSFPGLVEFLQSLWSSPSFSPVPSATPAGFPPPWTCRNSTWWAMSGSWSGSWGQHGASFSPLRLNSCIFNLYFHDGPNVALLFLLFLKIFFAAASTSGVLFIIKSWWFLRYTLCVLKGFIWTITNNLLTNWSSSLQRGPHSK